MSKQKYYVIINRSTVNKGGTRVKVKEGKHKGLLDYINDHKEELDQIHAEDGDADPVRFVDDETWEEISVGLGKFEIKTLQIITFGSKVYLCISHQENLGDVQNAIRTGKESEFKRKQEAEQKRVDEVFTKRTASLIKTLLEHGRNNYSANDAKHSQLRDVMKLYPEELLLVPGFGPKRVFEVINALRVNDLISNEMFEKTVEVVENYKKK